jgi:hypothetical protein
VEQVCPWNGVSVDLLSLWTGCVHGLGVSVDLVFLFSGCIYRLTKIESVYELGVDGVCFLTDLVHPWTECGCGLGVSVD